LYETTEVSFLIQGPKGRGLCLDTIPAGDVVIIAGGTGLFPFLDLIDEIFKFVVSSRDVTNGM
jgi:NAD(P)H-flavin reductase